LSDDDSDRTTEDVDLESDASEHSDHDDDDDPHDGPFMPLSETWAKQGKIR